MTEEHAKNLYRAFKTQGFRGTCDICGNPTLVVADVMTMKCRCFECVVRENLEYEERERECKKIPLDLKGFIKL